MCFQVQPRSSNLVYNTLLELYLNDAARQKNIEVPGQLVTLISSIIVLERLWIGCCVEIECCMTIVAWCARRVTQQPWRISEKGRSFTACPRLVCESLIWCLRLARKILMVPYLSCSFSVYHSLRFIFPWQAQVEHERKALDLLTNLEVWLIVRLADLNSIDEQSYFVVIIMLC